MTKTKQKQKQQTVKQIYAPRLLLKSNNYYGILYKQSKNGHFRIFAFIGNTGIAYEFAGILERLGFDVTYEEQNNEQEEL